MCILISLRGDKLKEMSHVIFMCVFYISLPNCEKKCLMRIKSTKSTKKGFASNSYSRTRQMPRSRLRQHPLTMAER